MFLHGACFDWWKFAPSSQVGDRGNWRVTWWTRHQHPEPWQKLPFHGPLGKEQSKLKEEGFIKTKEFVYI